MNRVSSIVSSFRNPVRAVLITLLLVSSSLIVYAVVTGRNPLCFPSANASFVRMTVENLTRASEIILVGSVQQVGPSWQTIDTWIFTDVTVAVSDFIKNPSADTTLTLRVQGGFTSCGGLAVSGQPRFAQNEQVLLFLYHEDYHSREPYLAVVGGPPGKITIVDGIAYGVYPIVSQSLDDLVAEIRSYL